MKQHRPQTRLATGRNTASGIADSMHASGPVFYDYDWTFRRDWVRDDIPWFVFAADRTRASIEVYNQRKLEYVRRRLRDTPKDVYLQHVVDHVVPAGADHQQSVESLVRFVQDATWHNPLECPVEADRKTLVTAAHELLELHDARCLHTAEILRQLFRQAGYDARRTALPSEEQAGHFVTEVYFDGEWHYTDANYFKEHVILRRPDGSLPTLSWLRRHPYHSDSFPGGWMFPARHLANAADTLVRGQFRLPFPEAENTWGADSYYSYYLGGGERYPPTTPPGLAVDPAGVGRVAITWMPSRSRTSEAIRYDVQVRPRRDGVAGFVQDGLIENRLVVDDLEPGHSYVARVRATDEQRLENPDTWYPWAERDFVVPAL